MLSVFFGKSRQSVKLVTCFVHKADNCVKFQKNWAFRAVISGYICCAFLGKTLTMPVKRVFLTPEFFRKYIQEEKTDVWNY